MSYIQQIENEQYEAAYNPADRFAGFDRGDLDWDEAREVTLVIGRMTNGAGQRVVITAEHAGDFVGHRVTVDGDTVFWEEDSRARAITVARWWMAGCPA